MLHNCIRCLQLLRQRSPILNRYLVSRFKIQAVPDAFLRSLLVSLINLVLITIQIALSNRKQEVRIKLQWDWDPLVATTFERYNIHFINNMHCIHTRLRWYECVSPNETCRTVFNCASSNCRHYIISNCLLSSSTKKLFFRHWWFSQQVSVLG